MGKCQRTYSEQQANGVCELISMDSIPIATAQQLLPKKDATPLYLWRFQNSEATVYLAGTVHILKESLYPLPQQYEDAYHATEKLVFEVDLSRYHPAEVQQKTLEYAKLGVFEGFLLNFGRVVSTEIHLEDQFFGGVVGVLILLG